MERKISTKTGFQTNGKGVAYRDSASNKERKEKEKGLLNMCPHFDDAGPCDTQLLVTRRSLIG